MTAFSVGVLRIRWDGDPPVAHRLGGFLYRVTLTEIDVRGGSMRRDLIHAALLGVVVVSPHSRLSRIVDVESHPTLGLSTGAILTLLLEDV